jgi:hypothetical protein
VIYDAADAEPMIDTLASRRSVTPPAASERLAGGIVQDICVQRGHRRFLVHATLDVVARNMRIPIAGWLISTGNICPVRADFHGTPDIGAVLPNGLREMAIGRPATFLFVEDQNQLVEVIVLLLAIPGVECFLSV